MLALCLQGIRSDCKAHNKQDGILAFIRKYVTFESRVSQANELFLYPDRDRRDFVLADLHALIAGSELTQSNHLHDHIHKLIFLLCIYTQKETV